jgi:ATP-binding cassette subfamily B multidrug efflux pump
MSDKTTVVDGAPGEDKPAGTTIKQTDRPTTGRGFGPPGGIPGDKSMNFGPSAKRLLRRLRPHRVQVFGVFLLAVGSVLLAVLGPKILGRATDIIFAGAIGKGLPAGQNKEQVIEGLRAAGNNRLADLMGGIDLIPGVGVDFDALRNVLLLVMGLYVGSFFLSWIQGYILNGVVQRTIYELRSEVEDKLNRLPLSYFDGAPRGELLSRVTNDIDNISTSLQQTLSQLLTSLLTVVGVITLMFVVSPLLALIALVTIPISMVLTAAIAKRSQKRFVDQWRHTGELNGQIEEAFTGHELVKVFGRQRDIEASFQQKNEELYQASFGAQFISGLIMPSMMFIGNLNYVVIAVMGGLRVASGGMSLGDVQAFIQYSRQFTQPLTQVASMANLLQSGVASSERVFEVLDAVEQVPDNAAAAAL